MTAGKRKKVCTPGEYCDSLNDRMEAGSFGKGLRLCMVINMKTGKERNLVSYRTGDRKDNGLILNFCPWCGGKLHNEYKYSCKDAGNH